MAMRKVRQLLSYSDNHRDGVGWLGVYLDNELCRSNLRKLPNLNGDRVGEEVEVTSWPFCFKLYNHMVSYSHILVRNHERDKDASNKI